MTCSPVLAGSGRCKPSCLPHGEILGETDAPELCVTEQAEAGALPELVPGLASFPPVPPAFLLPSEHILKKSHVRVPALQLCFRKPDLGSNAMLGIE